MYEMDNILLMMNNYESHCVGGVVWLMSLLLLEID